MISTHKKTVATATGFSFLLPRGRLTNKIRQATADTVWIGAPRGMGKSVLLRQIRDALADRLSPQAILCLQIEPDHSLQHLQAQLATALGTGGTLTWPSDTAASSPSLVDQLILLTENIAPASRPLHLLVDGLETRQHGSLIHYLIQSCQALAGRVRLYLAVDNFVPLLPNTLFLDQRHLHLGMQELRITQQELSTFAELHGQTITEPESHKLLRKTDGIPAVVALLLENYGASPAQQCLLLTEWIEQNLLCYLEPMEILRLASLSTLPQFDLNQAARIIGVPGIETRNWLRHYIPLCFHQCEASGNFVWSNLMQSFFFNMLLERYRDLLPNIFARVEPWLMESHASERCLDYVISAIEKPWAQNIILTRCTSWYGQRDATSVIELLERMPEDKRILQPEVALYYGWALIVHRRLEEARQWIRYLEENQQPQQGDSIFVLKALAEYFDHPRKAYNVRVAILESCVNRNNLFQGEVLSLYANMLHAVGISDISKNALQQAIRFHENNHNLPHLSHARMLFWRCEFNEGNTESARRNAQQYLTELAARKLQYPAADQQRALGISIAMIKTGLAEFLQESDQLDQARQLYLEAIPELTNSDWLYVSVLAQVGLTRVLISQGEYQQSLAEIERIKQRIQQRENTSLDAILCFETMRVLRAQGKPAQSAAAEYEMDIQHLSVESLFMDQYSRERLHWIKCYAMILIEQKNYTSALIYAVKGLIKSLSACDTRCRILFSSIKALCEFKLGQHEEAFASMNISMQLVQQHQFTRTLLNDDFGWTELWQLMDSRRLFSADLVPSFLSSIRASLEQESPLLSATPPQQDQASEADNLENSRKLGLTEKEYEILNLLAEGLCNKKIASRSEIALTTVKWHLQNIFGKLQARNRTEAVVKAQEHAIIGKN